MATYLDTTVCTNTPITLKPLSDFPEYLWDNALQDSVRTIINTGIYWITGAGNCAVSTDTIVLKNDKSLCDCSAILPSCFTPNNDGLNDKFHPLFENGCYIKNYAFSVYNRWGQCVFKTNEPSLAWDGTVNGIKSDIGTYMYQLTYTTETGQQHKEKGDVILVR